MKIGELAKKADVSTQTIRYYEREGILSKPSRTEAGYRDYPPDAVDTLRFVREAKDVGFTLREIKLLADVDPESTQSCGMMQTLLKTKLDDLDEKLASMKRIRKRLVTSLKECKSRSKSQPCPVLHEIQIKV